MKQLTVIETTLTRRGDGTPDSPIRVITQYWSQEGDLIIEHDPCDLKLTREKQSAIRECVFSKLGENDKARELFAAIEVILAQ